MTTRTILNSLLFLLISISQCTSGLAEQLQGKWIDMDDMKYGECPDVIFFHKSGRYVVFNDSGSTHPWIPVVERGNWEIKNKNIVLTKDANELHNNDSITLAIKNISKEKLVLVGISKDGEKYTKTYKRDIFSADKMQRFIGLGNDKMKLKLTPPGDATLLKLDYKLLYPGVPVESCIIEVLIEDQDGHKLWEKALELKHGKGVEEILLADKHESITLTHLVFKVKAKVSWELKVKVY